MIMQYLAWQDDLQLCHLTCFTDLAAMKILP